MANSGASIYLHEGNRRDISTSSTRSQLAAEAKRFIDWVLSAEGRVSPSGYFPAH